MSDEIIKYEIFTNNVGENSVSSIIDQTELNRFLEDIEKCRTDAALLRHAARTLLDTRKLTIKVAEKVASEMRKQRKNANNTKVIASTGGLVSVAVMGLGIGFLSGGASIFVVTAGAAGSLISQVVRHETEKKTSDVNEDLQEAVRRQKLSENKVFSKFKKRAVKTRPQLEQIIGDICTFSDTPIEEFTEQAKNSRFEATLKVISVFSPIISTISRYILPLLRKLAIGSEEIYEATKAAGIVALIAGGIVNFYELATTVYDIKGYKYEGKPVPPNHSPWAEHIEENVLKPLKEDLKKIESLLEDLEKM